MKGLNIISFFTEKNTNNEKFALKNGDTLEKYKVRRISTLTEKKGVFINLLSGISSKNNLVMIADKNFNDRFDDDTIYSINISKEIDDEIKLVSILPCIKIPNIKIKDKFGVEKFFEIELKFSYSIIKEDGNIYDLKYLKSSNSRDLDFYPTKYLTNTTFIEGEKFEFCLIPHPISFNYFKYDAKINPSLVLFKIYKLDTSKTETKNLLYTFALNPLLDSNNLNYKRKFRLVNRDVYVQHYLFDKDLLQIGVTDTAIAITKNVFTELETKLHIGFLKTKKLTLIEFTGSWCLPCRLVVPQLKEFFRKYNKTINFISIFAENNTQDFNHYQEKNKLEWLTLFTPLHFSNSDNILNYFGVNSYPTFLLIDESGNIKSKEIGKEGLEKIFKAIK